MQMIAGGKTWCARDLHRIQQLTLLLKRGLCSFYVTAMRRKRSQAAKKSLSQSL